MPSKRIIAAVLLVVCVWLCTGGALTRFRHKYSEERIAEQISKLLSGSPRRGVAAYWSFDATECKSPERGIGVNTVSAKGAHCAGLRFDGDDDTFYATIFPWRPQESFSISFWINAKKLPVRQDVIFQGLRQIGIHLDSGEMFFDVFANSGRQSVSFPFLKFGEFAHITAVADMPQKRISLYENGVLRASQTVDAWIPLDWDVRFGRCSLNGKHHAFAGTLDEVALWNKALSPREISRLASSPSATRRMALSLSRRFKISRCRLLGRLVRAAGAIENLPSMNIARWLRARRARRELPRVRLVMDSKARRHLQKAHIRSRASGHRTAIASKPVRAFISSGDDTIECLVSLGGGTLCYPHTGRPGYVIDPLPDGKALPNGCKRILLAPPETSGWLVRFADCLAWRISGLPSPPPLADIVSLSINGRAAGCYVMCDYSQMLVQQGEDLDPLHYDDGQLLIQRISEHERLAPARIPARTANAVAGHLSPDVRAAFASSLQSAADALRGDVHSPIPLRERERLLQENLESIMRDIGATSLNAASFLLDESLVIGGNRASWFIEGDLDLSSIRVPSGWSISFESQSPEWIDDAGHMAKRPEDSPAFASIVAKITDASGIESRRTLEFRLVPQKGKVPAIFVWAPVPFGKTHRTDASVEIVDPARNDGGQARYFTATGAGGHGGIRFKGNASFFSAMKLPNIKLDTPHNLFGKGQTQSLIAIDSFTDPLRTLNGLAYDLFRSFPKAPPMKNYAPQVKIFEVFLNGRYRGLLEFAERMDRDMLGEKDIAVFRHMATYPRTPFVRQSKPSTAEMDFMPRYTELISLLEGTPDSETQRQVSEMLDLENVVDFQILYSFFANANGNDYRFWTHDAIAWSPMRQKLFFVPWDFDLIHGRASLGIVRTDLDRWLERELPEHRQRMRERWRELRQTVLTAENVADAFDKRFSIHAGYLPSDARRWNKKPLTTRGFERMRDEELAFLLEQLERLDREYGM